MPRARRVTAAVLEAEEHRGWAAARAGPAEAQQGPGQTPQMELALDPDDQDLLGFLLEESGALEAAPDQALEPPLNWELSPSENSVQALSDWEFEDLLDSLLSPPPSLDFLSSSKSYPVHHDHTYSFPREHVSIDVDSGSCGTEEAQITPPYVEEPAEQEVAELILTEEEKRLLEKDGFAVPGTLPLTKMEEQALKQVRRKIRNKRSAQESRRKKKVYVGTLENRVLKYTAQNLELQNKVQLLEEQNLSLLDQLRKLQAMVIEISNKTTSSSTCVLVLLFSFCLLLVPAMYSSDTRGSLPAEYVVLSRQLRALPSEDPHQLELPALQPEKPTGSINQLLDSSNHVLQALGNNSCLLYHMPQAPPAKPPLQSPLPDLYSESPFQGPILSLQANLTRKGEWRPTHSPPTVILQGRYSG